MLYSNAHKMFKSAVAKKGQKRRFRIISIAQMLKVGLKKGQQFGLK